MTDITPFIPEGLVVIESYRKGGFRVENAWHNGPVLVAGDRWFGAASDREEMEGLVWPEVPAELVQGSFAPLFSLRKLPEVVLVGMGTRMTRLSPDLVLSLRKLRLGGLEAMATPAACRTYNVLLAEGRTVAAFLFPIT